jgi:hypothetical protein
VTRRVRPGSAWGDLIAPHAGSDLGRSGDADQMALRVGEMADDEVSSGIPILLVELVNTSCIGAFVRRRAEA